jgi:hypothetical protein
MIAEPTVEMCWISERRAERSRDQEESRACSWLWIREDLSSAKRGGKGTAEELESEAKTEEISPSFLGPRERGVLCTCVAVVKRRV